MLHGGQLHGMSSDCNTSGLGTNDRVQQRFICGEKAGLHVCVNSGNHLANDGLMTLKCFSMSQEFTQIHVMFQIHDTVLANEKCYRQQSS